MAKKVSGADGPKKVAKCRRCSRGKVGTKHTAFARDMATRSRGDRLLARAVLQPFGFKEKEKRPSYFKGSRDAFIEAHHLVAVKNGDKLLRVPQDEQKDDGIHAFHFACNVCTVQASGDYAVVGRGLVHATLHGIYRGAPAMSLR